MVSAATQRLYARIQSDFAAWCDHERLDQSSVEHIAQYLEFCLNNYGPTTVPQRVAAIAKWYRDQGKAFDTKATVIQTVLRRARRLAQQNK